MGAANSNGSLTAKLTGIKEAFPTAFNCLDLAKSRKIKEQPMLPQFLP